MTQVPDTAESRLVARGLSILAAEDNKTNRMVLQHILKPLQARVVYVEDGRAAVEAAADTAFDVILMDIQMPVLDGVAATVQIRAGERAAASRAPAVILATTANTTAQQVEEYRAAGMNGCLAKPILRAALVEKLATILEGAERVG